ncbi:MAG: DUF971 domain-containing protein [Actinomycetota bacterium]
MVADPSVQPIQVDVDDDGVVVTWGDEHVTRFELVDLRLRCTCAQCRELRAQGATIWPRAGVPEVLRVIDAELAGGWGLTLKWNDRHETGIYPWETLREWCRCAQCSG